MTAARGQNSTTARISPMGAPPTTNDHMNVEDLRRELPSFERPITKVDKENSGYISIDELDKHENYKRKPRSIQLELLAAVILLSVALVAHHYSVVAIVRANQTTKTKDLGDTAILTDIHGKELRFNSDLYEYEGISSQVSDRHFAQLQRFTVGGELGFTDIHVNGFTRLFPINRTNSTSFANSTMVILFTPLGELTIDWYGTMIVSNDTGSSQLSNTFKRIGLSPAINEDLSWPSGWVNEQNTLEQYLNTTIRKRYKRAAPYRGNKRLEDRK